MGGWPVGYLHNAVEELNSGLPRTNPDSGRVKDLNQGTPDFKSSALNHSATPPPYEMVKANEACDAVLGFSCLTRVGEIIVFFFKTSPKIKNKNALKNYAYTYHICRAWYNGSYTMMLTQ